MSSVGRDLVQTRCGCSQTLVVTWLLIVAEMVTTPQTQPNMAHALDAGLRLWLVRASLVRASERVVSSSV
jgi:hypothetical protein